MQDQVTTSLGGAKYTYKFNGSFHTWFDEKNMVVPVLIHTKLREKALSEGADVSIFLSKPKIPRQEEKTIQNEVLDLTAVKKPENKQKKLINLGGGFNPFAS